MKKITMILTVLTLTVGAVNAQKAYEQGSKVIHLWAGFAPTLGGNLAGLGYSSSTSLPLAGSFEYGVSEKISVGLFGGSTSTSVTDGSGNGFKESYLVIGARLSRHFSTGDKFDPYYGVMIAYNKVSVSDIGSNGSGSAVAASGLLPGGYLGANYYFTDNIGINGEIGYGVSLVNLGVVVKF